MRTYLLPLYALLLLALTGGTCEFRASSQHPVNSNPPEGESTEPNSGLLVDIRVGESRTLTADSPFRVSVVGAALPDVGSYTGVASRAPVASPVPSLSPLAFALLGTLMGLAGWRRLRA